MKRFRLGLLPILMVMAMLLFVACAGGGGQVQEEPTEAAEPEPTEAAEAEPTEAAEPEPTEAAEPEPTEAAELEQVEMHMAWWGSQTRHDRTIAVIDLFMAEHPNIMITYEFSSFGDYWPLLATKAAAGELPDIIQQDYAYFIQYINDELIIPLDPFVEDGTIDLSDVPDAAVDGGRVNGQLYALNLGTNSQSFVIDLDLFEQAGVPVPEPDWTWTDFEETVLAIHEALGIYGLDGGLSNPQIINGYFLSLGQGLYNDDGTALGFTDAQLLADYFAMMVRLQEAGAVRSREDEVAAPATLEDNTFVRSESAMYFAHTNQYVALATAAGEGRNLMMVPMPRAEGATQPANYYKASQFFSISAHSEHPVEAAMFIDFFTNSIEANEILGPERGVAISTVVQEAIKPNLTPAEAAPFEFLAALETSPIRPPDPAKHGEIQTNIAGPLVIDPLMFGQITPEEAAQIYMDEINALLAAP
ncbi:MAG: extracellular solute-binding protein [Chloroflexi bacterium]|nr:extracellular solute-binding protein [Chloroflexota bacterium]